MILRGFTYVELVVTIAIVGVLAAAALPMLEVAVKRNKELELRTALREIRRGIDSYKKAYDEGRIARRAGESGYPASLRALVEGIEDAKSTDKARMYFMRRVPRDPFVRDPQLQAPDTWATRSYASPPDAPVEGEDVFDVYSRTAGVGLNGIPYREW